MSPKGSMKILPSAPVRAYEDWPNHSTCMVLLQFGGQGLPPLRLAGGRGRGLVGVLVLAAAHQRGAGGGQAGDDCEEEGGVEAVAERAGDQMREEALAGEDRFGVRAGGVHGAGADQVFD